MEVTEWRQVWTQEIAQRRIKDLADAGAKLSEDSLLAIIEQAKLIPPFCEIDVIDAEWSPLGFVKELDESQWSTSNGLLIALHWSLGPCDGNCKSGTWFFFPNRPRWGVYNQAKKKCAREVIRGFGAHLTSNERVGGHGRPTPKLIMWMKKEENQ